MYLLPSSRIDTWWPKVEPLLSKAFVKTNVGVFESLDELRDRLESDLEFCFISSDCSYAGVFSINESRDSKVLYFWLSGGEEPSLGWDAVDSFLCEVSRVFGCKYIQLVGRLGWKRLTEPLGYSLDSIIMIKEVDNESVSLS